MVDIPGTLPFFPFDPVTHALAEHADLVEDPEEMLLDSSSVRSCTRVFLPEAISQCGPILPRDSATSNGDGWGEHLKRIAMP
jgi:hypothetical protein